MSSPNKIRQVGLMIFAAKLNTINTKTAGIERIVSKLGCIPNVFRMGSGLGPQIIHNAAQGIAKTTNTIGFLRNITVEWVLPM